MHRIAHFINIAGTDTLLEVRQTTARRMGRTLQIRNQRMHARRGEQTGGVIFRNQRSTLDLVMTFADKKVNIFFTDFSSFHD